jgi:uracil-DNA glycosylase family 4
MTKCTRCNCHKNEYGINCIPFSGNSNPVFYFLGEMAGRKEAEASKSKPSHFIGDAGERFNNLLKHSGIAREDVAVANANRCYKTGNATPTDSELDACFIHTFLEVQQLNPKIVVAMGESALYSATGLKGIRNYRGKLLFSKKLNKKVFATYHPAAGIYDNEAAKKTLEDFRKLPSLLDAEVSEIRNYSYKEVTEVPQELLDADTLYIDTETTGLSPQVDKLNIIQISNGSEPIYIFNKFDDLRLKEILETKNIVGQGWEFDAKFLKTNLDIFPEKWSFDTCLAEFLLTGTKANDLTFLVSKYARESFGYDDKVKEYGGAHKVPNKKELYQYAANDVGVLKKIKDVQEKLLVDEGMDHLYYNLTLPANKILTKMALRGILVDVDRIQELDKKYETKSNELLENALALPEVKDCEKNFNRNFNPRSTLMLRWLLLERYKLPILKTGTTSKGEKTPVLDAKRMKIYAEKHKNNYCQIMEKYRSYQTLRENFLSGILPKLVNGVAYTTYSLHATDTGRPNSTNPNLLNLPGGEETEEIRTCFIARPGCIFVYSDLSQIEVKVSAVVYDEPELIRIVNSGRDFHCEITSRILGLPYEVIFEGKQNGDPEIIHKRRIFKTITFSILYGKGAESLAVDLGITVDEAEHFIDEYFRGFPDLKRNLELCKKEVIQKGYLTNLFGFRRRWKYHKEDDHNTLREAINFPVQSTAWNLLELGMIKADSELSKYNIPLITQVYDSLGAEANKEDMKKAARIMKKAMQSCNHGIDKLDKIIVTADVEVGYNLKDMEKIG